MAFKLNNLTDKVRQMLGGMPSSLDQIGQNIGNNINDNKGFVQQGKFTPLRGLTNNRMQLNPQFGSQLKQNYSTGGLNPNMGTDFTKAFTTNRNNTFGNIIDSATTFDDLKSLPQRVRTGANFAGSAARGGIAGTLQGTSLGLIQPNVQNQGGLYRPAKSLSQAISSTVPLSRIGSGIGTAIGKPISATALQGLGLKTALSPAFIGAQTAFGTLFGAGAKMLENIANNKSLSDGVLDAAKGQAVESFYRAPSMGATIGLTGPAIEYAGKYIQGVKAFQNLSPTVKAQILDRVVGSTLNVLEGLGLDKTQGMETDALSVGIDAATGAAFGTKAVKGLNDPLKKSLKDNIDLIIKGMGDNKGFIDLNAKIGGDVKPDLLTAEAGKSGGQGNEILVSRHYSNERKNTDKFRGGTWYVEGESGSFLYDLSGETYPGVGGEKLLKEKIKINKPLRVIDEETGYSSIEDGSLFLVKDKKLNYLNNKESKIADDLWKKWDDADNEVQQREWAKKALEDIGIEQNNIKNVLNSENVRDAVFDNIISVGLRKKGYDALIIETYSGESHIFKLLNLKTKAQQPLTPDQLKAQKKLPRVMPTPKKAGVSTLKLGKNRGFVDSVQEAPDITKNTKAKVEGTYVPKPNVTLMGEAQALLQENASIEIKGVEGIDKKVAATIQEAINLDKAGDHQAAANLYNNLSKQGTELGRGVQAFSLLKKMSPEAVSLSAAGKIRKYNAALKPGKKKIPELTGPQVTEISKMVEKIDSLNGREKNIAINDLETTINAMIPSTLVDKVITVWKAGLLTSLRTHERNLLGNTIMNISEGLKDLPAVLADKALSLRTGQRTLTVTGRGTVGGTIKGLKSAKDIVTTGFDPEDAIGKHDIKNITWGNNPMEQALKKYTDAVFRTLGAADKPFWQGTFSRSLYDQAGAAAINAGKQGDEAFIQKLVKTPTEDMLLQATKDANYATFKDKNIVSAMVGNLKRAAAGNELTKFITEFTMPFTGVPSSVVEKTIAYSPIGLLKGIKTAVTVVVKNIPELQRQASQELGRGVIGTAIFALGASLMQQGLMTGQAKDNEERDLWKAQGKQENSVLIDGKWRGINSIGPQNLILLAGGKYNESQNDPEGSLSQYGANLTKDQLSQTFLQGVQGPLQAINDSDRYAKSYVGRTLASVNPNIIKDVAKSGDNVEREANKLSDYFMQGIPGQRQKLVPKRTVFGDEIPQEPTGVGAFIDLFNSKTPIESAVLSEFERLSDAGLSSTPSKLSKTQRINKRDITLTPEQLDRFEKDTGEIIKPKLIALLNTPEYQQSSDDKKSKTIGNLISDVRADYKKNNTALLKGETQYATESDSPKGVNKAVVNTVSLAANPIDTMKLWQKGEPIRKVRLSGDSTFEQATNFFGAVTVSERAKGVSDLDGGDKSTQVDHIIPKWLGGRETSENYQIMLEAEHAQKTKLDNKLLTQFEAGDITKNEALAQIAAFNKTLNGKLISDEQAADMSSTFATDNSGDVKGETYDWTDKSGNTKTIDISEKLVAPKLTGEGALDKKLISKYKSSVTKRVNDITKLYESGKLTAKEAGDMIDELNVQIKKVGKKSGSGKAKKLTKFTLPKVSATKLSKINLTFGKPPTLKLKRTSRELTSSKKRSTMRIRV